MHPVARLLCRSADLSTQPRTSHTSWDTIMNSKHLRPLPQHQTDPVCKAPAKPTNTIPDTLHKVCMTVSPVAVSRP